LPQRLKPLILLRAFERSGVAFSLVSFFWRSKRKKLAIGEMLLKISTLQAKHHRCHGTTQHTASNTLRCHGTTPSVVTAKQKHAASKKHTRCHGTTLIQLQFYPYQAVV
jgi:hypothetical protein